MKYVTLYGMFENKIGSLYDTYNDINDDLFTWKHYDIEQTTNS